MTTGDIGALILTSIESSMEDTRIPDAIAAYADKRAGKTVTKTDAEQLEAQIGIPIRIRRQYGMTHVSWTTWTTSGSSSRDEHSILLAHSETNVRWPSSHELRAKEPAYFAARDERNAARKALLSAHHKNERLPPHIERTAAAIVKLREAREELLQLADYGQPMSNQRRHDPSGAHVHYDLGRKAWEKAAIDCLERRDQAAHWWMQPKNARSVS